MPINISKLELFSIAYLSVASLIFIIFVLIGRIARKNFLGNGVYCGIVNSLLLSSIWPITLLLGFIGWAYDIWQGWKRL